MSIEHATDKIVLISFGANVFNFSVNSMAAYLRELGYNTNIIQCIPINSTDDTAYGKLSKEQLEILAHNCKNALIIGISIVTTQYLNLAIQVNDCLKTATSSTIVWGGVPVICDHEFYLRYTDYICVSEGEYFLEELLKHIKQNKPIETVKGIAYRDSENKIIVNPAIPLVDINSIPLSLFNIDNHFILKNSLTSLRDDLSPLINQSLAKGYRIFSIRGCPFRCSFCSNNQLSRVLKGIKKLRKLKNDMVIKELLEAKKMIPGLNKITFSEDDFFSRSEGELSDLLSKLREKINLPINISATIKNISEKKIELMQNFSIELESIKIGLQTGSERVNREIYKRPFIKDEYLDKLEMLAKRNIPVVMDVISDNPYENLEDLNEKLEFFIDLSTRLSKIKDVWKNLMYLDHKLMFYPGTDLYNMAIKDGIITKNYINDILLSRRTTRKDKEVDIDKIILSLFKYSLKFKFLLSIMRLIKSLSLLSLLDNNIIKKLFYKILKLKKKIILRE